MVDKETKQMKTDTISDVYKKTIDEQSETDMPFQTGWGFDSLTTEFGFKMTRDGNTAFKYVDSKTDANINVCIYVVEENGKKYTARLSIDYSDTPTFEISGDSPFDAYRKLKNQIGLLASLLNSIYCE